MAAPLTVAVTGLHRGDNPQPGAAVIRSLRRLNPDIRIVGLSYDPLESALYSHDIDRVDSIYLLPFPMKGPEMLLERMLYIHEKEQLQILIPCLDSELSNFMTIYPELKRQGVAAMLPTRSAFDKRAKENLAEFCKRHSFAGPRTFAANDVSKLAQYAEEIGYPVYVKGKYYEAWLVHTTVDLVEKYDSIARIWGLPVLVQEALVGEEFDVLGLADGGGEIVGHCAIRKLLRTRTGKGFGGVVVNDPEVTRMAKQIIKALRWSGPFEIEFLKSPGQPHLLFEINPRFPAWVDFPSQIGCNLPVRLLEMLLGTKNPTKLLDCDAGQMFIRHSIDLVGDIAELAKLSSDGEYVAGSLAPKIEASK
jgi:carbamoyl-phosphate synthase large subunit